MYPDDFLSDKLADREEQGALRTLRLVTGKIDFCSNDYLGIATKNLLPELPSAFRNGSAGSRLLSGNYPLMAATESMIAAFHDAPAALLFNSGYDANTGLLACIAQRGDTILYDQLSHASIRDGIRLSFAQSFSFLHNDLDDLRKKLPQASGRIFIVTESVFSMDGDLCPLNELVALARQYNAHLIIDEAHATGVIGKDGGGLVQLLGLQQEVFARVHTFGKACGCHGAVVLGSERLKSFLVNFARSLVYTTALPEHAVAVIRASYEKFPRMHEERQQLQELICRFRSMPLPFEKLDAETPIQGVVVPGNTAVTALAEKLDEAGFDVRPIRYPTVPKGRERLRIVLHAFNSAAELDDLFAALGNE
jgi:8-amino-7-oxononanoate synthase